MASPELLLSQLHDINLPPPPSWWPPAIGWWLVGALLLILTAIAVYHLILAWLRYRSRQQLLQHLQSLVDEHQEQPQMLLQHLSLLLRSLAIYYYGREKVAKLTDQAWLEFLARAANSSDFTGRAGKILLDQPYRKQASKDVKQTLPALLALIRLWIKRLPPAKDQLLKMQEAD